ncbi:MAG: glycosyltransferase [Pyrinomonadaceae bacterium]
MHLTVISHKVCTPSDQFPTGYKTDGGFPLQIGAISELFSSTEVVVPCESAGNSVGLSPLHGRNVTVNPVTIPLGTGFWRKIDMLRWVTTNGPTIWRAVRNADAVHAPIPGDVGTIGMVFALILRKRLFVRHCGNWLAPRTTAERLWKWTMERFAGGRNVMLATGGSAEPPSSRNAEVRWIFSTSLRSEQMLKNTPRDCPRDGELRLIIACRQEERKGTDVVIDALPSIAEAYPGVTLEVVGGGSLLESLKLQADRVGIGDRVVFHGKVEQAEVVRLLKTAHLFCYPTSASEGFPKVVLEALAAGLPVITTRVSVLPRLIESGCGKLLNEGTPAALAEAVIEICADPAAYGQMSRNAIATARQYTLEKWRDLIGQMLCESWKIDRLDNYDQNMVCRENQ